MSRRSSLPLPSSREITVLRSQVSGRSPTLPMPAFTTTLDNPASTRPLPRAWLIVAFLWGVGCLNYLDRIMITTMRDSLIEAIPMTDAQFGLLTSVFLWVYAVLSPFAGFVADRFNRSRVIITSLLVWSLVTWFTGHAKTFEQLLAARALMGISEAAYIPAALALITDYHRGPTRSLANAVHLTGINIGAGLGGMGGWLAERHGWSFAFSLFGIFGVAYSLLLMLGLRDPPPQHDAASATNTVEKVNFVSAIKSLFGQRSFLLLLTHWGLMGLACWGILGWMPTYLRQQFHLGQGEAGFSATGYLQTASLAGLLCGGAFADRWSRFTERGRIFVAIIGMCIAAPAIFLTANTETFAIAIAGLMIFGFASAFTDGNTMPILCLVSDPRYRATGFGVLNLFACGIGGLTIYAGGALRDANVNVRYLFQLSAGGLLVCAVLLAFIKPKSCKIDPPHLP